jgi:nicotinic acid mononucleotide adenylyltransferase
MRLATLCEFAVVRRPHFDVKVPAGFRYQTVDADTSDISSSEIRTWCATGDERLKDVLPTKVYDFITATGLYK